MTALPNDMVRCDGHERPAGGWVAECETCLRRTAPRDEYVWMMVTPTRGELRCALAIAPFPHSWFAINPNPSDGRE